MRPNWLLLAYLGAMGVAGTGCVVLASTTLLLKVVRWLVGYPSPSPEVALTTLAVVAFGFLPWPGAVLLARAFLKPSRPTGTVDSRPVGDAAVALIALNEEPAIDGVVRDFAAVRQVRKVIVVDNMSSDRTAEIAARAGAHVVKELRRGYGFACQRALREAVAANQPVVILCEADGTFRAADIEKLVVYLRHSDVVIGSRTHSALLDGESQLNSFFILGNLFVAKLLQARYWDWTLGGRVRLTDVGCTYVAIRAEALRRILPSLEVGSNHFIPHFLMVALEHGLRVVQVPVTFWKRVGISKGGNANWWAGFRLGLLMIWHILTYRVKSNAITVPAEEFGSS